MRATCYLGGDDSDSGRGIAVDEKGNAYVTGLTFSTEASFPVKRGPDLTFNGDRDAFSETGDEEVDDSDSD